MNYTIIENNQPVESHMFQLYGPRCEDLDENYSDIPEEYFGFDPQTETFFLTREAFEKFQSYLFDFVNKHYKELEEFRWYLSSADQPQFIRKVVDCYPMDVGVQDYAAKLKDDNGERYLSMMI